LAHEARRGKRDASERRRRPKLGARVSLPPDESITLSVYLRHRQPVRRRPGSTVDLAELMRRVSHEELKTERKRILQGPVEQVHHFATQNGLTMVDVDFLRRCVKLRGTASDVERTFATKLIWTDGGDGRRQHCPARKPQFPRPLTDIAHAVLGLDGRPARLDRLRSHVGPNGGNGLYPSQIARLYGIATDGRGAGQCIAIIEPKGGYSPDDVIAACRAMHVPMPQIVDINVGGGRNVVGKNEIADKEVALDIQVVAGVASEAKIAVYFTESNEPGLVAGVCEAVHGSTARPNVIVITWGEPEELWPTEARNALDAVLQDAIRLGITVVASAGDELATDRMSDGKVHVDYPASSPYVLGCGGTRIALDATQRKIVNEVVWNDGRRGTGGGISEFYFVPAFQSGVQLPNSLNDGKRRRGVPDVAATAADANGYRIVLSKTETVTGGTSAVAPLWAAFIALLNEQRGTALGFINERIYRTPGLFNAVRSGNNIDTFFKLGYESVPDGSWNACTGLGTPNGPAIVATLTAMS
jgi:kumamolisin